MGEAVVIQGSPLYNITTPQILSIHPQVLGSAASHRYDDLLGSTAGSVFAYNTPRPATMGEEQEGRMHTGEVYSMTPSAIDSVSNSVQGTPIVDYALHGSRLFV